MTLLALIIKLMVNHLYKFSPLSPTGSCEPQQQPVFNTFQTISCALWLAMLLRVTDPRSNTEAVISLVTFRRKKCKNSSTYG